MTYSSDVGSEIYSSEILWGSQTISFTDDIMIASVTVDSGNKFKFNLFTNIQDNLSFLGLL